MGRAGAGADVDEPRDPSRAWGPLPSARPIRPEPRRRRRGCGHRSNRRALRACRWSAVAALAGCAILLQPSPGAFAQSAPRQDNLRVFLDCQRCDFDHFRREAPFVAYVRDRADADVHVLVTQQGTAAGGQDYSLFFIGLGDLDGAQDTLRYVSRPSDTQAETRDGLVSRFMMGLMRYVAGTPAADLIRIAYDAADAEETQVAPPDDPWNLWVFRVRVGGEIEGESRQRSSSLDGSISASRTTEDLKIDISSFGRYESDRFEFSDDTIVSTGRDMNVETLVVWSLGPHWSLGGRASALSSTEVNQDLTVRIAPALEYSVFPYSESTRQQISVLYSLGLATFDYDQITLFDERAETFGEQRLEISAELRQPWGDIRGSVEASMLLHDPSQHRVDLFANIEYRIFRGLDIDIQGNVARVKDQRFVARGEIPPEEVFLERTQLGTDFEYGLELGLSFRFGSVFNTVVNPRMGGNRDRRFFN